MDVDKKIKETQDNRSTFLDLSHNKLTELPNAITKLTSLTLLDVSNNQLTELPDAITNLKSLTQLNLSDNQLTELPHAITNLTNLTLLDLSGNKLTKLPEAIIKLTNLTLLELSNNQLTELPDVITKLTSLTHIYLEDNQLSELPDDIKKLASLTQLYLDNNQLTELPDAITKLKNLIQLDLFGNPLKNPPIDIVEQGIEAIREYFIQKQQHGTEKRLECAVLLLGEPNVGKTTLRKKTENHDFVPDTNESRTVGVDILHLNYAWRTSDKTTAVHTHWFDFGGQEIQHMCHQFFLKSDAFNVLMFNDSPCEEVVSYWITLLKNINPNGSLLPVCNQFIGKAYTPLTLSVVDALPVLTMDLKNDNALLFEARLNTIKSHIYHYAVNSAVDWIKPWGGIVEELVALKNEGTPHIGRTQYRKICSKNKIISKEGQDLLLNYLNSTGQVFYFPQIEDDTLFIDPNWLIKALYTLLKPETKLVDNGYFDITELENCWSEPDEDAQRCAYSEDDQSKLKRLILKGGFNICYKVDTQSNYYFVPQYLSNEPKLTVWNDAHGEMWREEIYLYKVNYIPLGFMSQLIVKLHDDIAFEREERSHWLHGMVLKLNVARCIIEEKDDHCRQGIHVLVRLKGELNAIKVLRQKVFVNLEEVLTSFHFYGGFKQVIPCLFCYENETSDKTFELDDKTMRCPNCQHLRIDNHNIDQENITMNDNSKHYNISNSPGAVQGDDSNVIIKMKNVSVGQSPTQISQQIEHLNELLGLLQNEENLKNKELFIRHVENAKEELSEDEPVTGDYQTYLKKASGFLNVAEKTTKLYNRGKELLISLGAIIIGSGIN